MATSRLPLTRNQAGEPEGLPSGTDLSAGGGKVVLVATPTLATDAANKGYVDSVASGQLVPDQRIVPGCYGRLQVTTTSYTSVGSLTINPSKYSAGAATQTLVFAVVLEVTTTGETATIRLVNESGVEVTSSQITSTAAAETAPERRTATLTVGASPNLLNVQQTYDIQVKRNGGSPSNPVFCRVAQIEIDYT